MLLIKNGRVVDPVSGVDKVMDVLVEGLQPLETRLLHFWMRKMEQHRL